MNESEQNNTNSSWENEKNVTIPVQTDMSENFPQNKPEQKKTNKPFVFSMMINCLLIVAVVILYILHFAGNKNQPVAYTYTPAEGVAGTGEIVYINIDTINAHYKLVEILTDDIDAEKKRQEVSFANRQKTLENKYAQFQKNYQANILTQVQVENTQMQLMQESETLQQEYEQVLSHLQARQMAALQQIADSLIAASQRVNSTRNASFIFSYQYGGQLIVADPTKDLTGEVLQELNNYYTK